MSDLETLEKKIGVKFKNQQLLITAITHRSYLNESKEKGLEHNERLEFLGDAVLELVVTEFLYTKYARKSEGELTSIRAALVNTTSISLCATSLSVEDHLLLSKGEAADRGRARQYILANTYESIIGAIHLDLGYAVASEFIHRTLLGNVDRIVAQNLWQDPKSLFQERAQEEVGVTPTYKTMKEVGPDHAKRFTVGLYLDSELVVRGEGFSKQEAETDAAKAGLKAKGWN